MNFAIENATAKEFGKKSLRFFRTVIGELGIPFLKENIVVKNDLNKITKIYDLNFNSKHPIYINRFKNLALIPLEDGDYILKIFKDITGNGFSLLRIIGIDKYSNNADVEIVYRKASNEDEIYSNSSAKLVEVEHLDKLITIIESF